MAQGISISPAQRSKNITLAKFYLFFGHIRTLAAENDPRNDFTSNWKLRQRCLTLSMSFLSINGLRNIYLFFPRKQSARTLRSPTKWQVIAMLLLRLLLLVLWTGVIVCLFAFRLKLCHMKACRQALCFQWRRFFRLVLNSRIASSDLFIVFPKKEFSKVWTSS